MVERGGLENRCGCKPTQGSNPCLSATFTPTGDGNILKSKDFKGKPLPRGELLLHILLHIFRRENGSVGSEASFATR